MALAISACGGASHALPANSPAVTTQSVAVAAATFTFIIPDAAASTTASKRAPQWINAATQSIRIVLTGAKTHGTATDIFANVPAALKTAQNTNVANTTGNPNTAGQCGTDPGNAQNIKCTATIQMPVGDDTFLVTSWDGTNGTGNEISAQQPVLFVQQAQANAFTFTLDALATTLTVTPPGSNVALSGTSCPSSPISGASDLSSTCTAIITGSSAVTLTLGIKDAHGTVIPSGVPGEPALSASSSNSANFSTSLTGSSLTVTPHTTSGNAVITITGTPANSSGAPGDGLSSTTLKFTVAANATVTQFPGGYAPSSALGTNSTNVNFLTDAVGADGTLYVAGSGLSGQSSVFKVTNSGGVATWTALPGIACFPTAGCAAGTTNSWILFLGVDASNHVFGNSGLNVSSGSSDLINGNVYGMAVVGSTMYYASSTAASDSSPLTFYSIPTASVLVPTGLPGTQIYQTTIAPSNNPFSALAADATYIYAGSSNNASNTILVTRIRISDGTTTSYSIVSPVGANPALQSLAIDPTGRYLYAVDSDFNLLSPVVLKIDLVGGTATQIASSVVTPTALATDSSGALYVTDLGSSPFGVFVVLNP